MEVTLTLPADSHRPPQWVVGYTLKRHTHTHTNTSRIYTLLADSIAFTRNVYRGWLDTYTPICFFHRLADPCFLLGVLTVALSRTVRSRRGVLDARRVLHPALLLHQPLAMDPAGFRSRGRGWEHGHARSCKTPRTTCCAWEGWEFRAAAVERYRLLTKGGGKFGSDRCRRLAFRVAGFEG